MQPLTRLLAAMLTRLFTDVGLALVWTDDSAKADAPVHRRMRPMVQSLVPSAALPLMLFLAACQGAEPTTPIAAPVATPSHLVLVDGGAQQALAGVEVPLPVRVRVTDQRGAPMAGQSIVFGINEGGGLLAGSGTVTSSVSTGPDGVATAPTWTLGKWNTPQTLTATLGALSLDVPATIATQVFIDVRYVGEVDPTIRQAMTAAVNRLTAMLTDGLPSVAVTNFDASTACLTPGAGTLSETVRGTVIYVSQIAIDGPRGAAARGGTCLARAGGLLPAVGLIQVDVADLALLQTYSWMQDIMMHELLHAMGFGVTWRMQASLMGVNRVMAPLFTGGQARQACTQIVGVSPWACDGGVLLSADQAHWSEEAFGVEMMTPYFGNDIAPNPLSAMTIAAMADLGFTVNFRVADAFQLPSVALAGLRSTRASMAQPPSAAVAEIVELPRFVLTSTGAIQPLSGRR